MSRSTHVIVQHQGKTGVNLRMDLRGPAVAETLYDGKHFSQRPQVAVAYDIFSSSPMELIAALGGLCDVVWVVDGSKSSLGAMHRLLPRLGQVVDTAGRSPEQVADTLRDAGIDGVIAFTDTQLSVAASIGHALGLAGNPLEVVDRLNDKVLQRTALSLAGIAVPSFRRICGDVDLTTAISQTEGLTFPLVIKPCRGESSRDVVAIENQAALRALLESSRRCDGTAGEDLIAEEYLRDCDRTGREMFGGYVSVEMIVQDGRPVPLAITGRFPLAEPFRETGSFMPHALDLDESAAVLALAADASRALGVRSGALHTEIKLTPHGPRIIEVNGRIGGGGIDALYARTHGQTLTRLATRVAMGEQVDLVAETARQQSGPFYYEFFLQPPRSARRLTSIAEPERLAEATGVERVALNCSLGDELDWRRGSQGFLVQVGGTASDRAALSSVPATILESVDVTYE